MRKIKFRAWDKDTGKMVYSDQVYPRSMYKFEFDSFNDFDFKLMKIVDRYNVTDDNGKWYYQEMLEAVDADIMQYTGMKDAKGKEICEGDIVKVSECMAGEDFIGKVIYDELEGCYFIIRGSEKSYCKITIDLEDYCHYVIGNIYENPGLLG